MWKWCSFVVMILGMKQHIVCWRGIMSFKIHIILDWLNENSGITCTPARWIHSHHATNRTSYLQHHITRTNSATNVIPIRFRKPSWRNPILAHTWSYNSEQFETVQNVFKEFNIKIWKYKNVRKFKHRILTSVGTS